MRNKFYLYPSISIYDPDLCGKCLKKSMKSLVSDLVGQVLFQSTSDPIWYPIWYPIAIFHLRLCHVAEAASMRVFQARPLDWDFCGSSYRLLRRCTNHQAMPVPSHVYWVYCQSLKRIKRSVDRTRSMTNQYCTCLQWVSVWNVGINRFMGNLALGAWMSFCKLRICSNTDCIQEDSEQSETKQ